MSVFDGLIQGIIQGLTEFLPISSSGHLVLYQAITGTSSGNSNFFNLMLHLGTLAAVIAAYYKDLWGMIKAFIAMVKEIFTGKFRFKTEDPNRKMIYMLVVATLPLVLVLPVKKYIDAITANGNVLVVGICLLITSGLLFLACKVKPGRAGIKKMKVRHAVAIGVMQGIATVPGISRSGSTISTGLILGFNREFMVKFSFLLGIPAILGGAASEIGDVIKAGEGLGDIGIATLVVGVLASAVVGYLAIYLVRWLAVTNKFIIFAIYTLVVGVVAIVVAIVTGIAGGDPSTTSGLATSLATSIAETTTSLPASLG